MPAFANTFPLAAICTMQKFKIRPHDVFLVAPVLVYLTGSPLFGFDIDTSLFDTYFIVSVKFLTWLIILGMALYWAVYSLAQRLALSKILAWAHCLLTVILSVLILMIPYFFRFSDVGLAGAPRRYYDYDRFSNYQKFENMASTYKTIVLSILLVQLIFIMNIVISAVQSFSKSRNF